MTKYHINSKNDLYKIGVNNQLGPIILSGRLETVFDAREHVVNTIQRINKNTIKMRKYTFEKMENLDDFLEMDLAMDAPMFQRLRNKILNENPSLLIGEF
jgi:hypothetical protein